MQGNDYGKNELSSHSMSVSADEVVKALRLQFESSLLTTPVIVGSMQVSISKSITGQGGHRYWFICPACSSRVAKLYSQGSLAACRHCLHIKYRTSRYKGMVEGDLGPSKGLDNHG